MPRFPGGEVEARGPHPSVIGCGGDLASPERSPPQTHPSTFPASSWPLYSHLTGWLFDLHLRSSVRMDGASQYFVPYLPDLRRRPSVARGVAHSSVQRSSWSSLSRINRGQLARLLSDVMPVALQTRERMCRSHRLARRAALATAHGHAIGMHGGVPLLRRRGVQGPSNSAICNSCCAPARSYTSRSAPKNSQRRWRNELAFCCRARLSCVESLASSVPRRERACCCHTRSG